MRPSRKTVQGAMLCACLSLVASPRAWSEDVQPVAAQRPNAVIVSLVDNAPEQAWPEAEKRLAAELELAGMGAVVVQGRSSDAATLLAELNQVVGQYQAVAAICIVRSSEGGEVTVWLEDAVTGKFVLRRIPTQTQGPDAAGQVVLAVVELLHASFLEVRMRRPGRPVPEVVEEMVVTALGESTSIPLILELGGTAAGSFNGIGPLIGPRIGVGLLPVRKLRLDLDIFGSVYSPPVRDQAGEAQLNMARLCLFAGYEPLFGRLLSPSISVGGGFLLAWARGEATRDFQGDLDNAFVGLIALRLALALRVSKHLRAFLSTSAGLTFPEVALRFLEKPIAQLGRPVVDTTLGLALVL